MKRVKYGKEGCDEHGVHHFKTDRRAFRFEEKFFELFENAFFRKVPQRTALHHVPCEFQQPSFGDEFEACGELDGSQESERIFDEGVGIDAAQPAPLEVADAAERVEEAFCRGIVADGIDGEVAASGGGGEIEVREGANVEGPVAVPRRFLRTRQGKVDVEPVEREFEHAERLSRLVGRAQSLQRTGNVFERRCVKTFDIDIFARHAEQGIADESSDNDGTDSGLLKPFEQYIQLRRKFDGTHTL